MPTITDLERAKYDEIWQFSEYKNGPQGPKFVDLFLELAIPSVNASVVDLGCGAAQASILLKEKRPDLHIELVDISTEAFGGKKPPFRFYRQSLWERLPNFSDFGFCCDVMEHIPVEFSMAVLINIIARTRWAFFHIAFEPDVCGQMIGQPLHMTVMPFAWWRDHFKELSTIIECRDLIHSGIFFVEGY